MNTIIIDKYLILNSKSEVLVFIHEGKEIDDIFLPRMIYGDEEEIIFQQKMMDYLYPRVINEENEVYLYEQEQKTTAIGEDNKRYPLIKNKRYLACAVDFDDSLVSNVNAICGEYNIMPVLLPIRYLKNKAWRNIKVPWKARKINIDLDLPKPLKILEMKLDYTEY
ncbi:MAG: hypothetical protein OSJ70_08650 [Bacilli bacterium]|nr:hypothetical protein [Bacilli bacterium]